MKWNEDRIVCIVALQLDTIAIASESVLHTFDQKGKHSQYAFSSAIQSVEWIDKSALLVETTARELYSVKEGILAFHPDLTHNSQDPISTLLVKLDTQSAGLFCVYDDVCMLYRIDASLKPSSLWQHSIDQPKSVHFSSFYPL